ncbi:hypothetical protein GCM10023115_24710 [Pontixanthobacter gangjinensis]|uniref:WG repeat-containing protein n=1 Tax=Christiangramia aestuarii TaxID=1028746 RepID=A0A7K1LT12_9FLAO|nr:WG repeat-containing protein [Christiangramia aestuarii]MUP43896.1 WG repeat-containing protein [Christiangramia aestuarii]
MELIPFKENNLWGYKNLRNEVIIEPKFIFVTNFKDDYAIVCAEKIPTREFDNSPWRDKPETIETYQGFFDHLYGIINKSGEYVVNPKFKRIFTIGNQMAKGILYAGKGKEFNDYCQNKYFLINFHNYPEKVLGRYSDLTLFSNNFWLTTSGKDTARKDYCWLTNRILNDKGEDILEIRSNSKISDFENGIIKIGYHKTTQFFNEEGTLLCELEIPFEKISKNFNSLYFFQNNDNEVFILNLENQKMEKTGVISKIDKDLKSKVFKNVYSRY